MAGFCGAARSAALCLAVLLVGCASPGPPRVVDSADGPARDRPGDLLAVPDAVPRVEPRSRGGNKSPYSVLGRTYYVMEDSRGYVETGIASWYGAKFHGRLTSNGEVYDMYGMTAAHKALPLPTYVRVTNLENDRSVVVRVNDRGPFHDRRIIDLTYTAATKLGFVSEGVARVRVEAIDPSRRIEAVAQTPAEPAPALAEPAPPQGDHDVSFVLQLAAFTQRDLAYALADRLFGDFHDLLVVEEEGGVFRVRLGPFPSRSDAAETQRLLGALGFAGSVIIELHRMP